MKQAQNARKQRGRSSSRQNGKAGNQGNRSEQKVRGNPKQLVEKYKNQAREALQSGDRTQAEYFLQFADHYYRVLNEMRGPSNQADGDGNHNNRRRRRGRGPQDEATDTNNSGGEATATEAASAKEAPAADPGASDTKPDPVVADQPTEVHPELDLGEDKPKPVRKRRAPRRKPAEADAGQAQPATEKPAAEGSVESEVA